MMHGMAPFRKSSTVSLSEPERGVPNAAWSWFTDERAVIDLDAAGGPRVLVGCVTARDGSGGGDVAVLWYDVDSDDTGHAVLYPELEQDDHDTPALFVRPDGRYLAVYAGHSADSFTRWRVSTRPHDPTDWQPEHRHDNGAATTYSNVCRPDDAGLTYCFTRATNWDPDVLISTDAGLTWTGGRRLLTFGDESARPYLKYWADGARVHLVVTEEHPAQRDNSVYHGFLHGDALYDSTGAVVREGLLAGAVDGRTDVDGAADGDVPSVTDLTPVSPAGTVVDGTPATHAWPLDLATDAGNPVTLFQARADGDPSDHRFLYARHDGDEWHVDHLAEAGGHLYDAQPDYTGLAAIDPDDTNRVVVSTTVDPRSGRSLDHHQLFAGETHERGATWEWHSLTPDATRDNLRPIVPAWNDPRTALIWMHGRYSGYTDWKTQAVGALDCRDR